MFIIHMHTCFLLTYCVLLSFKTTSLDQQDDEQHDDLEFPPPFPHHPNLQNNHWKNFNPIQAHQINVSKSHLPLPSCLPLVRSLLHCHHLLRYPPLPTYPSQISLSRCIMLLWSFENWHSFWSVRTLMRTYRVHAMWGL